MFVTFFGPHYYPLPKRRDGWVPSGYVITRKFGLVLTFVWRHFQPRLNGGDNAIGGLFNVVWELIN
jgi:hypothetical protein